VSAQGGRLGGAISRRQWLCVVPAGCAALAGGGAAWAEPEARGSAARVYREFPAQNPESVRAVVTASHGNIDRVRELVEASPALAKAAWDWGFGDWETALGAASHMGRADIATLLIAHGARPNLFTLAMLGKVDAVRACVAAMPGIQRIPGPHGITLLQHARNGGDAAKAVVAYLEGLGDADPLATSLEMTDALKATYVGRYAFGDGDDEVLEVAIDRRGGLTIVRPAGAPRRLHRVEEHGFAPVGAPQVRIRFRVERDSASAVTIHDPEPVVTAVRG